MCNAPAAWRARPIAATATWWTYCDHCRPAGAEPIPLDQPYHVTRVTVTAAIASVLESRAAAAEEAARQVAHALEDVGAVAVRLHVHGRTSTPALAEPPAFRLLLAGPGEPLRREPAGEWPAPTPARWRFRRPDRRPAARQAPARATIGARVRGQVGGDPRRATGAAGAPAVARRGKGAA